MRAFVAAALTEQLTLDASVDLVQARTHLARDGSLELRATGTDGANTLPFLLNFNARVDNDFSERRLRNCFSASIKFGGGKDDAKARVAVVKLDAAHGHPWHLHPFDRATGSCVHTRDARLVNLPDFRPHTVGDAFLGTLRILCKWEVHHDPASQLLPGLDLRGPSARPVPLVV
jgi:hypothetical protein